jgi:hypothetical protein
VNVEESLMKTVYLNMKQPVEKQIKKGKPLMLKNKGKQLMLLEMDLKKIHILSIKKRNNQSKWLLKKLQVKSLNGKCNRCS